MAIFKFTVADRCHSYSDLILQSKSLPDPLHDDYRAKAPKATPIIPTAMAVALAAPPAEEVVLAGITELVLPPVGELDGV